MERWRDVLDLYDDPGPTRIVLVGGPYDGRVVSAPERTALSGRWLVPLTPDAAWDDWDSSPVRVRRIGWYDARWVDHGMMRDDSGRLVFYWAGE
jgi:hypothetical protein